MGDEGEINYDSPDAVDVDRDAFQEDEGTLEGEGGGSDKVTPNEDTDVNEDDDPPPQPVESKKQIITDPAKRRTFYVMTNFEYVRAIGTNAEMLADNAPHHHQVGIVSDNDIYQSKAEIDFRPAEGQPHYEPRIHILRPTPRGIEKWMISELLKPHEVEVFGLDQPLLPKGQSLPAKT